jgi:UDP-glucose 4-epimerase
MKVFITGGTGNVGQYVTKSLLDAGHEVKLLTRTPERIPGLIKYDNAVLLKGSLDDFEILEEGIKGSDAVIQMAVRVGESPLEMVDREIRITAFMLDAAARNNVKKYILTSSVAAMKKNGKNVFESDHQDPIGLYGAAKASDEMLTLGFDEYFSMCNPKRVEMCRNIIRPTNTYTIPAFEGGASTGDPRFQRFVRKLLSNDDIRLDINDGEQFICGRQIAKLFVKLLDSSLNEQIFFGAGSKFITWVEIVQKMKNLIPESTSKIIADGMETKHYIYDPAKMEKVFGLKFEGDEYLEEYLKWEIDRTRRELNGEIVYDSVHH